jgi:hypothetical protein
MFRPHPPEVPAVRRTWELPRCSLSSYSPLSVCQEAWPQHSIAAASYALGCSASADQSCFMWNEPCAIVMSG